MAFAVSALAVGCATLEAQQVDPEASATFEVSGRVTSKTDTSLEIQTRDNEMISIAINESTEFALRMSNPWFDTARGQVAVDGKKLDNGEWERIKYSLPEGKLFLLAQFRSVHHRDRIMSMPAWRINNYLISGQPIEAAIPTGKDLLLAGELDIANSKVIVGGKSYPIILGFRGATLRGRTFAEIVPGEAVVLVTGTEVDDSKVANTILFMTR